MVFEFGFWPFLLAIRWHDVYLIQVFADEFHNCGPDPRSSAKIRGKALLFPDHAPSPDHPICSVFLCVFCG